MLRQVRKVSFEFAGERLDLYVSLFFENISRTKIQDAIEKGLVLVNENTVKKSHVLRENDKVFIDEEKIRLENPQNMTIVPQDIPLDIIWEDENYVAVNKSAGLSVHPGHGQKDGTLLNGLYHYLPSFVPRLVHRLDKNTSGVILAAKNDTAHEKLSKKFLDREIYKGYVGICIGKFPDQMNGTMDFPIGRDKKDPIKKAVDHYGGRDARTDYKIIDYKNGIYFVCFRLHSGRTHQIRVHCEHSGFPIICDSLYGGDKEKIKHLEQKNRLFAVKVYDCFSRQALHARILSFENPMTKKEISLTAPFPDDFEKAIKILEISENSI